MCDDADTDGNGYLNEAEIMRVLETLQVPGLTPAKLQRLSQLMDVNGDNACDYSEFQSLLILSSHNFTLYVHLFIHTVLFHGCFTFDHL